MSFKRRSKGTRYAGSKTHGRGRKNRTRGAGNRGGVGMSGSGKRGDAKKTLVIHWFGNDYFGKQQRGHGLREKKKLPSMSLNSVVQQLSRLVKEGKAKEQKGSYDVNLEEYKIVGKEMPSVKVNIHARAASVGAMQAVSKHGGSIVVKQRDNGTNV